MKYPIFNLCPKWEVGLIQEFIRFDNVYKSSDISFFHTYFLGQKFVDSEGQLYSLDWAEDQYTKCIWPFKKKIKILHFRKLGQSLTFEELKNELVKRANNLCNETVKQEFIKLLGTVETTEELLSKI
jgi:hypothetical protein